MTDINNNVDTNYIISQLKNINVVINNINKEKEKIEKERQQKIEKERIEKERQQKIEKVNLY